MKKYIQIYLTIISISLTMDNSSYGQKKTVTKDSLLTYMELAAKNNPTVQQRYMEYMAALQKVPQVGNLPDPELNLGIFLSPMELVEGKQVADIKLMQMFPWFGVLKNARDEMSLMAKAKFELFRDAKLQVFYDVRRTWYELYRTGQDIEISKKSIEILRTIERLALVKFKTSSQPSSVLQNNSMGASSGVSAGLLIHPMKRPLNYFVEQMMAGMMF